MVEKGSSAGHDGGAGAVFERLYFAHHRTVLAYCARRLPRSDAWDATSEVFVTAWRRIEDMPDPEGCRAWLLGVAHKVISNQRRGWNRRRRLTERVADIRESTPASWPEEQLIRTEDDGEVIDMLKSLALKDREILLLRIWEDLSPTEIATVLGISRAAVDQRYSRARRRAARQLARLTTARPLRPESCPREEV